MQGYLECVHRHRTPGQSFVGISTRDQAEALIVSCCTLRTAKEGLYNTHSGID